MKLRMTGGDRGALASALLMVCCAFAALLMALLPGNPGFVDATGMMAAGALIILGGCCWLGHRFHVDKLVLAAILVSNLVISLSIYSVSRTAFVPIDIQLFYLVPILVVAYFRSGRWIAAHCTFATCGYFAALLAGHSDVVTAGPRAVSTGTVCLLIALLVHRLRVLSDDRLHQVESQADRDPLTGLLNRRGLDRRIAAMALPGTATVVIIDLDHFKSINDLHGHRMGDDVLCAVAGALRGITRTGDVIARIGGEEIVCVFPDMSSDLALAYTQRLAKGFNAISLLPDKHITASFGITEWQIGETIEDVVRRADAAMYEAKAFGRNRSCIKSAAGTTETVAAFTA